MLILAKYLVYMTTKVAIFDLDATLIDTETLKENLIDFLIKSYNFSKNEAWEMYNKARDDKGKNTFSLERLGEVLGEEGKLNEWFEKIETNLLIKGAGEIINFFVENKVPIYILTLGVKKWQMDKIKKSGLDKFLTEENIKFTDEEDARKGKEKEIQEILKGLNISSAEGIIFFNDKPDETIELLKKFPEMRVIIRREQRDNRYQDEDYEKIKEMGAEVIDDLDIKINKTIKQKINKTKC